jgi:hypothetical protein
MAAAKVIHLGIVVGKLCTSVGKVQRGSEHYHYIACVYSGGNKLNIVRIARQTSPFSRA